MLRSRPRSTLTTALLAVAGLAACGSEAPVAAGAPPAEPRFADPFAR